MAAFTTADKSRIPDERIDELFAEFDEDGSGAIDASEFQVRGTQGSGSPTITDVVLVQTPLMVPWGKDPTS